MEALSLLKTLKPGGVITADNASQVCDGASGVLVVSERALKQHCLTASWGASRLTDFAVRWQDRRAKLG